MYKADGIDSGAKGLEDAATRVRPGAFSTLVECLHVCRQLEDRRDELQKRGIDRVVHSKSTLLNRKERSRMSLSKRLVNVDKVR